MYIFTFFPNGTNYLMKRLDLINQRFGRLLVKEVAEIRRGNRRTWVCQCDCGETCFVTTNSLRQEKVKSCGCLRLDTNNFGKGELHKDWVERSLRKLNSKGYRVITLLSHENIQDFILSCRPTRSIKEHHYVMSKYLGRPLDTRRESIHHKNGDRSDNRIENLELKEIYHGKGQSIQDKVEYAIAILEKYQPESLTKNKK